MVSLRPIVSGDGPRDDPSPTMLAVRNSRLPTLSARDIVAGLMRPRAADSERRDGGRGMAMLPVADVGVGIWRPCSGLLLMPPALWAAAEAAAEMSPTSEKMSPRSAYRLEAFDSEKVGLCSGAYGCDDVGVDVLDAVGLCWLASCGCCCCRCCC